MKVWKTHHTMTETGKLSNYITRYFLAKEPECPNRHPDFLFLQQLNILINRCPAQIADSCQLADIQQPIAESRIVAEESRWNIVPGGLGAADWRFLGYGIVQAVADVSCPGYGFAGIGFGLVF